MESRCVVKKERHSKLHLHPTDPWARSSPRGLRASRPPPWASSPIRMDEWGRKGKARRIPGGESSTCPRTRRLWGWGYRWQSMQGPRYGRRLETKERARAGTILHCVLRENDLLKVKQSDSVSTVECLDNNVHLYRMYHLFNMSKSSFKGLKSRTTMAILYSITNFTRAFEGSPIESKQEGSVHTRGLVKTYMISWSLDTG